MQFVPSFFKLARAHCSWAMHRPVLPSNAAMLASCEDKNFSGISTNNVNNTVARNKITDAAIIVTEASETE